MAQNAKILIVEDDAHERQGLADLLSLWGYETETASDGSEALEKVSSFNPAVVISDLRMPRMTGMELFRQVHEVHSGFEIHHADRTGNDRGGGGSHQVGRL